MEQIAGIKTTTTSSSEPTRFVNSPLNGKSDRSLNQSLSSRPSAFQSSTGLNRTSSSSCTYSNVRNFEEWINQKSLRRIQKHHSAESHDTRQMYMTVLENEENFVRGIDEFLKENELLELRRKELLHKQWAKKVYEPTRRRIEQAIEEGYPKLDEKKREEYLKYLQYKNVKGDIFLDIMSRDEYDALALLQPDSPASIKVNIPRLQDPLLSQERKKIDEDRTVLYCDTGKIFGDKDIRKKHLPKLPLVPLGRHGTTCHTWLAMPFKYIGSPVRCRSREIKKRTSNDSTFNFAVWTENDPNNYETVKKEMKIQRRKRFPIPSTMPSTSMEETQCLTEKPSVRFTLPNSAPQEEKC